VKPWLLAHGFWIAFIVVAAIGVHSWIGEHDARLLAEQQIKVSEAHVEDLQKQMQLVSQQATKQVQVVTRIVHDVKTPQQAVAAIPQLTGAPLNTRVLADNPADVAVDAMALVNALGQCKQDAITLGACQATSKIQEQIILEKTTQVEALSKPKSFWKRFGNTLKLVGIGAGVGIGIGLAL